MKVILNWCIQQKKIGGPGATVEIDEANFGRCKYRQTRESVTGTRTNTIERRQRELWETTPRYGCRMYNFVGYLAVAYFKLHFQDPKTRLHAFMKAAATLYPPSLRIVHWEHRCLYPPYLPMK
ncbi:uncharacterized protein LOC135212918 [Macrobrachium nipponense]|uniref:uncharacterized protein LOC135212918 n=1 Tax=Macrobrachium nipponense TaxID=159736 RepID=UPI0030C8097C